jgi:hypothetical protein
MPERKQLISATRKSVAGVFGRSQCVSVANNKEMAPKWGRSPKVLVPRHAAKGCGSAEVLQRSQPEVGEIAVADRRVGTVEEQTIEGSQKAAKKTIGRSESNRSSVSHLGLISECGGLPLHDLKSV